jgi:hypothetical protein
MHNESIHGLIWPGKAWGAIELGHDHILVNSWLKEWLFAKGLQLLVQNGNGDS